MLPRVNLALITFITPIASHTTARKTDDPQFNSTRVRSDTPQQEQKSKNRSKSGQAKLKLVPNPKVPPPEPEPYLTPYVQLMSVFSGLHESHHSVTHDEGIQIYLQNMTRLKRISTSG